MEAKTVAHVFMHEFVSCFGCPLFVLTPQDPPVDDHAHISSDNGMLMMMHADNDGDATKSAYPADRIMHGYPQIMNLLH